MSRYEEPGMSRSKDSMIEARLANLCAQLHTTLPDVIRVAKKLSSIDEAPEVIPVAERVPTKETTHCHNGHRRTAENTGTSRGWVFCRDCKRERDAKSAVRRRLSRNAEVDAAMGRHPAGKAL